jgi:ribosomal protein S18 acetylase RimI-like enzyme
VEPLDNPVWHALTGPHQHLAERHGDAIRYEVEVAPFAALPDEPDDAAWAALRELIGSGGYAVLFRDRVDPPEGWEAVVRFPALQMVAPPSLGAVGDERPGAIENLSSRDVADMLALVERTQPGPFFERTIDLGGYVGVRHEGRLVAMAGERFRLAGHTEISAVCTDDDQRGRGLARALVRHVAGAIRGRADGPFLHVLISNVAAIRVYEALGFTVRREMDAVVVHPVDAESAGELRRA